MGKIKTDFLSKLGSMEALRGQTQQIVPMTQFLKRIFPVVFQLKLFSFQARC